MYMVIWNKYHRKLQSSNMATACHQICFICYHWSVGYAERKRTKTIHDNMTCSVRKTWPPSGIIACWKNVHASKQQLCQQVHAMMTNSWLKKKKEKKRRKKDDDNITSLLQQQSAESLIAMPVMWNSFVFVSFIFFFYYFIICPF